MLTPIGRIYKLFNAESKNFRVDKKLDSYWERSFPYEDMRSLE